MNKPDLLRIKDMKDRYILLTSLIILVIPLFAQAKESLEWNCQSLKHLCEQATQNSDHREALKNASMLREIATKDNNTYFLAYACYFEGISNVLLGNSEKGKRQLDKAKLLSEQIDNDTLIVAIYNGYGVYEANVHANYVMAQKHFFKSLKYAIKINDRLRQAKIESNLAEIAHIRRDTTGLKYAIDCYEWAKKNDNRQMIFVGAYHCANLLHMMGKQGKALKFLHIANGVSQQEKYAERCTIYKLYASIYLSLQNYNTAIDYLEKAIKEADNAQASTLPEVYLCYAKVRSAQHLYTESNRLIEKGLKISVEKSITSSYTDLYELAASNYEAMGDYRNALSIYKSYKQANDTIYNIEKERSINELRVQYDVDKKEQEANYQKLLLDREVKKTTILYLSLGFVLLLLFILYYFYYKQNRLYKKIVLQNRDAVAREENLKKKLKESTPGLHQPQIKSSITINDEKATMLYEQLCELMEEKRLYTDCNLTRERLSEILNTNRTYLSQVINEKAGLGYSQFINDYRIKEAIRVLSDKDRTDYPLKALCTDLGFNSMTTFYKLFQATIGMTPSTYRKTMLELNDTK